MKPLWTTAAFDTSIIQLGSFMMMSLTFTNSRFSCTKKLKPTQYGHNLKNCHNDHQHPVKTCLNTILPHISCCVLIAGAFVIIMSSTITTFIMIIISIISNDNNIIITVMITVTKWQFCYIVTLLIVLLMLFNEQH